MAHTGLNFISKMNTLPRVPKEVEDLIYAFRGDPYIYSEKGFTTWPLVHRWYNDPVIGWYLHSNVTIEVKFADAKHQNRTVYCSQNFNPINT